MKKMDQTKIKVELNFTRNLGNFESVKVGLGVEDWVREGENTTTATDRVYKFVETQLIEKVNQIESEIKGRK